MANEITYQFQILLGNGSLTDSYQSSTQASDQSTALLVRNVQPISNAAHSALDLGNVTTPGWATLVNLDDTNYVEIGIDVSGTFYPFIKLKPGERCLCRLGTTAPYAKANTASVDLFYIIYND